MSPPRKIIIDTDPVVYPPCLCALLQFLHANNATIRESTTYSPCSSPSPLPQQS